MATNERGLSSIRITAISALGRALGDNWAEFPPITTPSDPGDEWYRNTLERAFQRFVDGK